MEMNGIDANSLLLQMRAMAAKAQGIQQPTAGARGDFSTLMKTALDRVNETQQQASAMKTSFESGGSDVDIAQVMLASQKSRIAFEAVTQVRNRLVSAYQEIMNMPI
jgi:flagellar hook-basal body complex protein FliE